MTRRLCDKRTFEDVIQTILDDAIYGVVAADYAFNLLGDITPLSRHNK
jgi:hypothetical protein